MKRTKIVSLARTAVWLIVVLWCLLPIFWMVFMTLGSIGQGGAPAAGGAGPRFAPGPPDLAGASLAAKLMSSMLMLGLFFYACWCAAGVVCGFGLDRAVSTAENLFTEFFPKRLPPALPVAELAPVESPGCPQ